MIRHWPVTEFVAQTLGMKVAGLDEDGIDVKFTINGKKFNKERLRGLSGLNQLNSVLNEARPEQPPDEDAREATDMNSTLRDIFSNYWKRGFQKATTVVVLTDGVWEGSLSNTANEAIVEFTREVQNHKRRFPPRHFTIGFVRFGEGIEEKAKLQDLDDKLCEAHGLQ